MFKRHKLEKEGRRFKFGRVFAGIVVGFAIFYVGVLAGQGRLGPSAIFDRQVAKNLPADLDYTSIETVYDSLRANYDGELDVNKLLDGLKKGLADAAGDPYTVYLTADEAKELNEQLTGSFEGIGAELGRDADKNIIIIAPLPGTPAEKAGLRARDIIAQIDGANATGMSVDEAKDKIRGAKGSTVKLRIVRDGSAIDVNIVRDTINISSVNSRILDGNIGYMQITRFGEDTVAQSKQAASSFKQVGVTGVIVDVRSDPGGLLDASIDISSLWLQDKTVLTERRGGKVIKTYKSRGSATLSGVPTVVLVDEGSASASEILAGALRDNNAATLIGTKTFGKGSVQQLVKFLEGDELKVTIARWYTPSGKNIDGQGIEPDQKVERTEEDIKNNRDPQLDAAIQFLKK